jgi:hypothetical protein
LAISSFLLLLMGALWPAGRLLLPVLLSLGAHLSLVL